MEQPESLGERVLRLRGKRDRGEIAKLAGMPYSTLAELENKGKESTRCEYLVGLSYALAVTLTELVTGKKEITEHQLRLNVKEADLIRTYRAATPSERAQIDSYCTGLATRSSRSKRRGPRSIPGPGKAGRELRKA